MSGHRSRSFVLRQPRARRELIAVARAQGWSLVSEEPGDGSYVAVLDTGFPGVTVQYTELEYPRVCTLTVDSLLGPEPVGTVATLVQGMLVPWTLGELLAAAAREDGDRAAALRTAGIGAPGAADPAWLELFAAVATGDPDPEVRHAAVAGLGLAGWPEGLAVLEGIARDETHPAVRGLAEMGAGVLAQAPDPDRPAYAPVDDLFTPDAAPGLWRVAVGELGRFGRG